MEGNRASGEGTWLRMSSTPAWRSWSGTALYADELKNKADVFKQETKTQKTIMIVMITTFGTQNNNYKIGLVQNEVTMSRLFI